MNHRLKILPIILLSIILLSISLYSQIFYGNKVYDASGWDFSDTTSIDYLDPRADIVLSFVSMSTVGELPLGFFVTALHGAKLAILPDSTFEDLKYAPPDSSSLYTYDDIWFMINRTYVVNTTEGHYAKFRFHHSENQPITIEYVYQPDGSRRLYDPIGTEGQSWGAIKKLFQ